MQAARPRATSRPCPACGTPVDPLRAPRVVLLEDGMRFLCSDACRERFFEGERAHDPSPLASPVALPERVERDSTVGRRASTPTPVRAQHVTRPPWPWIATSLVALALAVVPGPTWLAGTAAALAALGPLAMLRRAVAERGRSRGFPTLPSIGALTALVAGLVDAFSEPGGFPVLAGASIASLCAVLRTTLAAEADALLRMRLRALRAWLPERARMPVHGDTPVDLAERWVATSHVRTGEEILIREGELVPVDGVVRAGDAQVLLFPAASTPVRRLPGDPLLAGGRVVEGAIRVLTTRIGEQRALLRPFQVSDDSHLTIPGQRITAQIVGFAPILVSATALIAFLFAAVDGLALRIAAVAAVLVAMPFHAVRRSIEGPIVAATATAVERGIVFADARAIEQAGRVGVAALCTHRTITEGEPEIVEVHVVEGSDLEPDRVLAIAAAAEMAAESHPIAIAVRRYADARGIGRESVRRATFVPGRGVTALGPGGEPIVLGNRQFLIDEGISVAVADRDAARQEERGHTVVFFASGGRVRALLALQDPLRAGVRAALQRMMDLPVEVVLLSGDHRATIEALAQRLDVTHVKAELLPDEVGPEVARLRGAGGLVAAVGHRDADGAALAAADVPITLASAGAPTGERAIALCTSDLRDAAAALFLARAARTAALRAWAITVGVGIGAVAIACLGWLGPGIAAILATAADAFAVPAGARLLRRIDLREPIRG